MTSDEWPPAGEAWIPFLRRRGRLVECVLIAWQNVEKYVDVMTLQEFGLQYLPKGSDSRVDAIREELGFRAKVELLEKRGRISRIDSATIHKFADERNEMFHGDFDSHHPLALPKEEKARLMELADRTSRIVLNRALGLWFDESTGDIVNKEVPRPAKQSGAPPSTTD